MEVESSSRAVVENNPPTTITCHPTCNTLETTSSRSTLLSWDLIQTRSMDSDACQIGGSGDERGGLGSKKIRPKLRHWLCHLFKTPTDGAAAMYDDSLLHGLATLAEGGSRKSNRDSFFFSFNFCPLRLVVLALIFRSPPFSFLEHDFQPPCTPDLGQFGSL